MSQLRLALAQVDPTVGDLAGNAALVRRVVGAGARRRGRTWWPSPRWCSPATPSRTSRSAPVVRRRQPGGAGRGSPATWTPTASATSPSSSATWTGSTRAPTTPTSARRVRPEGRARRTPPPSCTGGRSSPATPSTTCRTTASSTSSAIFVPGDDLTVVRVHGVDVAVAICEDLWQDGGPVAADPRRRRRAAPGASTARRTSATRTTSGCELVARRAAEAGCALAYVNMVGGQDELVFDGDSIVVAADGTVLARAPQFEEELLVVDLDLPPTADARRAARRRRRASRRARRARAARTSRAPARRRAGAWTTCERGLRAPRPRAARLRPQERLPVGGARAVRRHRLGAGRRHRLRRDRRRERASASRCRASYSSRALPGRRRRAGRADRRCDYRVVPIAPMVDAFLDDAEADRLAEENLQARVRGVDR